MRLDTARIESALAANHDFSCAVLLQDSTIDDPRILSRLPLNCDEDPINGVWTWTPIGLVAFLDGGAEEIFPWLECLKDTLEEMGIDGTLTSPDLAPNSAVHDGMFLSYQFWTGYDAIRTPNGFYWNALDANASNLVVDSSLEWLNRPGERILSNCIAQEYIRLDLNDMRMLLRQQIMSDDILSYSIGKDKELPKLVSAYVGGLCSFSVSSYEEENPCLAEFRALIDLLPLSTLKFGLLEAPHSDNGSISRFKDEPELKNEFIPWASGLVVVTKAHLDKAHDLSNWVVSQLDDDHFQIEAKELGPWLCLTGPSTETITSACHDFGKMIYRID